MDDVKRVLKNLDLPETLLGDLGVQTATDLRLIREEDLTRLGVAPVQRRKLLEYIGGASMAGNRPSHTGLNTVYGAASTDSYDWSTIRGAERLSPDEIAEFKGAFELFDKNRDGTVDVRELRNVLRSLGQDPTSDELMEMVEEVDFNRNGVIDFNEFLTMMISRLDNVDYDGEMIAAFRTFDMNGDGHISASELRHIMSKLGSDITDEEIDEMMQEAKVSRSGQIDYRMFVQMMMTK